MYCTVTTCWHLQVTQHVANFNVPIGLAHYAAMSTCEELLLTELPEPVMSTTASGQSQTAGAPFSHPARVEEFDVAEEVLQYISDLPPTKRRFKAIHARSCQVRPACTYALSSLSHDHLHRVSSMLGWLAVRYILVCFSDAFYV